MDTLNNNNNEFYSDNDLVALQLAIDLTLAEADHGRVEQVTKMLAEDDWYEVGRFCAYHRQCETLRIAPWQPTPSNINDPDKTLAAPQHDGDGQHEAALLLKKMLALGISQFHPDPVAAIEEAEKKR